MLKFLGREIGDYELVRGQEEYDELGMDSFLESGEWSDGTKMTDKELDEINEDADFMFSLVESEIY